MIVDFSKLDVFEITFDEDAGMTIRDVKQIIFEIENFRRYYQRSPLYECEYFKFKKDSAFYLAANDETIKLELSSSSSRAQRFAI